MSDWICRKKKSNRPKHQVNRISLLHLVYSWIIVFLSFEQYICVPLYEHQSMCPVAHSTHYSHIIFVINTYHKCILRRILDTCETFLKRCLMFVHLVLLRPVYKQTLGNRRIETNVSPLKQGHGKWIPASRLDSVVKAVQDAYLTRTTSQLNCQVVHSQQSWSCRRRRAISQPRHLSRLYMVS